MTEPIDTLSAHWRAQDPWDYELSEVAALQLQAAQRSFERCRARIGVLDRRAEETGVDAVEHLSDLVPLLFSHASYKSYPDTFVERGRWDRLTAWLNTLSVDPIDGVDFDGVTDIDGWVARLAGAGETVTTSSGTTGRTSFLKLSAADREWLGRGYAAAARATAGHDGGADRAAFLATPRGTTTVSQLAMNLLADATSRPEDRHFLSDEPLRAAQLAELGRLQRALARGTASPAEIGAAEQAAARRTERMSEQLGAFVDAVLARRGEPLMLAATYGLLWQVVATAKSRGISDGAFHPETLVLSGGGLKGVRAPEDFQAQIRVFFGPKVGQLEAFGMSELTGPFARCSTGHYHAPPTTLMMVLDRAGEQLRNPPHGRVEGRFAALDLLVDARWGGVISGDRVTVDFDSCRCGRHSPRVVATTRYSDLPEGDDKLSCAGSVDAYVRGAIEATA